MVDVQEQAASKPKIPINRINNALFIYESLLCKQPCCIDLNEVVSRSLAWTSVVECFVRGAITPLVHWRGAGFDQLDSVVAFRSSDRRQEADIVFSHEPVMVSLDGVVLALVAVIIGVYVFVSHHKNRD